MADDVDPDLVDLCYSLALRGREEGGVPVGSVLARGPAVVATGYNRRIQLGDPIAHGEMDCLRNAGRRRTFATRRSTLRCRPA